MSAHMFFKKNNAIYSTQNANMFIRKVNEIKNKINYTIDEDFRFSTRYKQSLN